MGGRSAVGSTFVASRGENARLAAGETVRRAILAACRTCADAPRKGCQVQIAGWDKKKCAFRRNRSPIPIETDHPFRRKPITCRSERRGTWNHESQFSRFLPPVEVIAWTLPSCRAWLDARQRALTSRCSTPVVEVGPVLFQISRKKMMGCGRCGKPCSLRFSKLLWARSLRPWERWRPQPPAAHRQCCSGRAGHGRRGTGGGVPPVPTGPAVTGLGLARPKGSVLSRRSSAGAQQRGTAVMSPCFRFGSRAGAVCASSLP